MAGHKSIMQDREVLYNLYWVEGKSLREIGDIYGVSFKRVHKWMRRLEIASRPRTTKGMKFPNRKLSDEHKDKLSKWRTGRKLSTMLAKLATKNLVRTWDKNRQALGSIRKAHGHYLYIKVVKGKSWKYLYRYLVEQKLGRELDRHEVVHHINFVSGDNNIDNLIVLSRKEHLKLHSQLEHVMRELMTLNIVYFDGESYCISKV